MIPVSLRLKNFMSYGEDAPELDFRLFRVACLSGRNGQGKSALLDAITWVLWEKARKMSGLSSATADLLRVGCSHMQVEFVFDVEGHRFRVMRTFARSASGKTKKTDLEIHGRTIEDPRFRLLSGPSKRETQRTIDTVIGVDYDAFVNSVFLLQGRSDEFTSKPPGKRKEILGRILDLGRYEELRALAADRKRVADVSMKQAEADAERLGESIQSESHWQRRHDDLRSRIRLRSAECGELRKKEEELVAFGERLKAHRRDAKGVGDELRDGETRLKAHSVDVGDLKRRLEAAEALIRQRDFILREHDLFQVFQKERDLLDGKREIVDRLEREKRARDSELTKRKHEFERTLDRLSNKIERERDVLREIDSLTGERLEVERLHQSAVEAGNRADVLHAIKVRREGLIARRSDTLEHIKRKYSALKARAAEIGRYIEAGAAALGDGAALATRHAELLRDVQRLHDDGPGRLQLQRQREAIRLEIAEAGATITALQNEVGERRPQLQYLRAEEGTCPTCGTDLTPEHRQEATDCLKAILQDLERRIGTDRRRSARLQQQQAALFAKQQAADKRYQALSEAPNRLAKIEERIRQRESVLATLAERKKEREALQRRIGERDFALPLRKKWESLGDMLKEVAFDQEEYERVLRVSGQEGGLSKKLKAIDAKAEARGSVERSVEQLEQQLDANRRLLRDGSAFSDLSEAIRRLRTEIQAIGFDRKRLAVIRYGMDGLAHAPGKIAELAVADRERTPMAAKLVKIEERIESELQKKKELSERLVRLKRDIALLGSVDADLARAVEASRQAEATLSGLRVEFGGVIEKLGAIARDRVELRSANKRKAKQAKRRSEYEYLRRAFSKDGIPSLIIEETLPEIEDRTNELLRELTDERMSVLIASQRDTQAGGTKETLEITVRDDLGVYRPYETYSGGEAFRVNFALRIALSEILAWRSSARIQTLVIDEGFGTQDSEGIANLVDVIRRIRTKFEKILVISHLQAIKDAFPVRIEVEKDPVSGSRFQMIGV